ncbi:MAG: hypothetical protein WCS43_19215 [Verrucomicrobiota bacterium]
MKMALARMVWMSAVFASAIIAQAEPDKLEKGFSQPPDSAKNQVWWHWLQGNVIRHPNS